MKKALFFFTTLMLLCLSVAVNAQDLADYNFSTGTDANQWITLSDGATSIVSTGDDSKSSLTDIGFSFPFGDGVYTQFWANANGIFSFSSSPTGNYNPQFSNSSYGGNYTSDLPKICGITRDLYCPSGAYVKYELTGVAPNRVLVCEFKLNNTSSSGTNYIMWQVQLHESDSKVIIVYGSAVANPSAYQIGLSQSSSDIWTINPSSHEATHATGAVTTTYSSVWPGEYRYYAFERPVISCPKPTGLAAALTPGNGSIATLSWTKGGEETNWVVEYSTASDFTGAIQVTSGFITTDAPSISVNLTGLTAEQTYYARVKADCGGGDESEWSNPISFTPTDAYTLSLNEGSGTNYNVPIYYYYISNSSLNTASQFIIPASDLNSIQWANIEKLTFYANIATANYGNAEFTVYAGETAATTQTSFTDWNTLTEVYTGSVSVNNNMMEITFDNPFSYTTGNLLIGIKITTAGTSPSSFSWKGVSGPTSGVSLYSGYSSTPSTQSFLPQVTISYTPGEAPSCLPVSELATTLTPGDGTVATLTWTENGSASDWVLQYGTNQEFTVGSYTEVTTGFSVDGTTVTANLTSLTAEQTYYARVKADCGENGESDWSFVTNFTPTNAIIVNSGTEGTNGTVPLATNYKCSYDQMIYTAEQLAAAGITGPSSITKIGFKAAAANTVKRLPTLYMGNTDKSAFSDNTDFISINNLTTVYVREYSDNTTDPDLWMITAGWNEFELDEPFEYDGTSNLVIAMHCGQANYYNSTSFNHVATTGNQVVYACNDNADPIPATYEGTWSTYSDTKATSTNLPVLRVYATPLACPRPLTLTASDITTDEASLSWTENGSATAWQICINSDEEHLINVTDNPYSLTSLTPGTNYAVKVRANCGDNGFSEWSSVYNFITEATCTEPSGLQVVDNSVEAHQAQISWTAGGEETTWDIYYSTSNTAPTSATAPTVNATPNNPYTITELTPNGTTYYVWVRAHCGDEEGQQSPWIGGISFATACDAVTTFPWREQFDERSTGNFSDLCWENEHLTVAGNYATTVFKVAMNTSSGNNTNLLQLPDQSSGNTVKLRLPQMNLPNNNYQFVIDVYRSNSMYNDDYPYEGIRVFASTDGEIEGATELTFIPRQYNVSSSLIPEEAEVGWYTYEIPIGISGNCYIILRGESQYCTSTYMDNFFVEQIPTCKKPSALMLETPSSRTAHTATLKWTNGEEGQNAWQIAYSTNSSFAPAPDFVPNGTTEWLADVYSTPATIEGLAQSTTYYAYVRANCGNGDYSAWNTTKLTFATLAGNATPTGLAVAANTITSSQATASWNAVAGNTLHESYDIYWAESTVTAVPEEPAAPNFISGITTTSQLLSSLDAETEYKVWVRDNCGNDGYSNWSSAVTFSTASACQTPDGLAANSVTNNSATLSWNAYGQTGFNLQYRVSGEEWDANNIISNVNTPYSMNPILTGNTTYQVRVQATCAEDPTADASWSNTVTFTTACEAITTFPKTYTFETSDGFPSNVSTPTTNQLGNCWRNEATLQNGSYSTRVWGTSTSYKKNGSQSLVLPDKGSGSKTMLVFPAMDFTSTNGYVVSFWIYRNTSGSSSSPEGFKVYASDCDTIGANAVDLGFYSRYYNIAYPQIESTSGWYYYETAPITMTGTVYIIFEGQSYYQSATYVDDVTIKVAPSCFKPTGLEANDITTQSAELSWTANSRETAWTLYYKKTSDENYTEVSDVTENPYTLPDLDHSTNYQFYVVANCSATDNSEASDVKTFSTECAAISADGYSANFDDYTAGNNVLPLCWRPINTTTNSSYTGYPKIYNYNANSPSNCLYLYSYAYYSGGITTYDPQPQYAILPEMSNLDGMRIKLQARGYNTSSTFKVGTMSDPTDASTFMEITNTDNPAAMTTSYQEYIFDITNTTDHYVAIMIEAANSTRTTNGVYIDDIVFSLSPTCYAPTEAHADVQDANNATISWTSDARNTDGGSYSILDADQNVVDGAENITGTSFPLSGLTPETPYTYYVHTNCFNTAENVDDVLVSFTTPASCAAPVLSADAFTDITAHNATVTWTGFTSNNEYVVRYRVAEAYVPNFTEDFEDASSYANWTAYGNSNTRLYFGRTTESKKNDSYGFSFNSWSNASDYNQYLISPELTEGGLLTFQYKCSSSNSSGEMFRVGYSSTDTELSSFSFGDVITTTNTNWQEFSENVPSGTKYICINYCVNTSVYKLFIDDITISTHFEAGAWQTVTPNPTIASTTLTGLTAKTPYEVKVNGVCNGSEEETGSDIRSFTTTIACPAPTNLTCSSVTAHTADLTWNVNGNPTTNYVLTKGNEESNIVVTINEGVASYTLANLNGETAYTVKVKANCGDEGNSLVSNEINFTTPISCHTPTYFAASGETTTSMVLSWTNGSEGQDAWVIAYKKDGDADFTEKNVTTNPYTLGELEDGKTYTLKIRANCGETDGLSQWSSEITHATEASCATPTNLTVSDVNGHGATISWTDDPVDGKNYIVMVASENMALNVDFENNSIPSNFTNDATYPWYVYTGTDCTTKAMRSSNDGVNNSTSAIEVTVNVTEPSTLSFDFWSRGEGTNNIWDASNFYIDGTLQFQYGQRDAWESYSAPIAAGTHILKWEFDKDGNQEGLGDGFYVDNIKITAGASAFVEKDPTTATSLELNDLDPETTYYVKVKGDCGSATSPDSDGETFTTPAACNAPTSLTYDDESVTAHTVYLSWTENNGATAWKVIYSKVNIDNSEITVDIDENDVTTDGTTITYTLGGLDGQTDYIARVKSNCGGIHNDISAESNSTSFTTLPACYPVTNVNITGKTPNSVTFTWEDTHTPDTYIIKEGENELTDVTAHSVVIDATNHTATISGLSENQIYSAGTFKVFADCGTTDGQSAGVNVPAFTTPCSAHNTFPWTETFNDLTTANTIPDCWNNDEGTTSNASYKWCYTTATSGNGACNGTSHDGSKCVRFNSYNGSHINYLKSIPLSLPTDQAMQLKFWYKNPTGGDFSVYISTDGGATHETALATGLTGVSDWTEHDPINLSAYADQEVVLVFKGTSNNGNGNAYIYLDDVTVEEAPACAAPTALGATAITNNSATLNWTANSDSYTVSYRTASSPTNTTIFSEGFETYADEAALEAVWSVIDLGDGANTNELGMTADAKKTDEYGFRFSSYSGSSSGSFDQYLISPELTSAGLLQFAYKSSSGTDDIFRVGYSTTNNNISDFTWGDVINSANSWKTFSQTMPEDAKYFAINYTAIYKFRLYIDDIVIYEMQPASGWQTVNTAETSTTLTDLTPETTYEAKVQGHCANDDSAESELISFTPSCSFYQLLTDASDLAAGDKIIIAAATYDKAMSTTQSTNNRAVVDITKNGNRLGTPSSTVQILTLEEGTTNGTWALNTGNGYLYAASSSNNYLKTQQEIDANASWTISVSGNMSSIVATESSNRNVMQFNYNSTLISCYASASQSPLAIYKFSDYRGKGPDTTHTGVVATMGDSYECMGQTFTASGDYEVLVGTSTNGCDSIRILHLTLMEQVKTPTFSPAEGEYNLAQNVEISCETADATIYYTTDGTVPTAASAVYSQAITVEAGTTVTIKAIAMKEGMGNSEVATATYTVTNQEHTITFNAGTGTCTTESMTAVSIDELPTATLSETCAQQGWAFYGWSESAVANETTEVPVLVSTPYAPTDDITLFAVYSKGESQETEFNFASIATANSWTNGTQYSSVTIDPVTLTANGGANDGKYYSSDNSWRIYSSSNGSVAITSTGGNVTAVSSAPSKEFSINNGVASYTASSNTNFTAITVTTSSFTYYSNPVCLETVATPTFTLAEGSYSGTQSVEISCATENATIYYTLDGSEPSTSSTEYTGAIAINETSTLKAIAVKDGMNNSAVAIASYTIVPIYTVTLDAGNGSLNIPSNTVEGNSLTPIDLSNVTATLDNCDGWNFAGWSTSSVSETTTAPTTFVEELYYPTADVTLYAVYQQTEQSGQVIPARYVKVTSDQNDWSGDYLIVCENANKAFNGNLTTLDASNNNIAVTIDNGIIESNTTTDAAKFIIAKLNTTTGYSIKSASGYYIGSTSNSKNELLSSTSTQYSNTISVNSGNASIQGTSRYLRYNNANNDQRFRYYTSSSQQDIQLYKYEDGTAPATTTYNSNPVCVNLYTITATADPIEGGTVSGAGTYDDGTEITLTATASEGYTFVNWTKGGTEVSTNATYSFTVTEAGDYVANFSVNSYEITASVAPDNSGSVEGDGSYTYGSTATLTAAAATGYHFVNWTEGGQEVLTEATYGFTVTSARELMANFTANEYTITYMNGEEQFTSQTYDYNAAVSAPQDNPTKEGYTFAGWDPAVPSTMPSSNVTVYAQWQINNYNLTVTQVTGGTISVAVDNNNPVTESTTADYNALVTLTPTPAANYLFSNWVVTSGATTITVNNNQFNMPAGDVTVTAVFTPMGVVANPTFTPVAGTYYVAQTVTVNCATEGASIYYTMDGSEPSTASTLYNGAVSITETTTLKAIAVKDNMTNSDVATALYRIVPKYDVVIANIANGTVTASPASDTTGATITLTPAPATGYHFGSWHVTSGNDVIEVNNNSFVMPAGNVSVSASFEPDNYNVTLNTNNGTINSGNVTSYTYGVGATLPTDVTLTGNTFGGWYGNAGFNGEPVTSISTTETGDKVFWAKWTINSYEIAATANPIAGGTVNGAGTFDHGATATLTATANTGYSFVNWTEAGQEVLTEATYSFQVTGERTLVANFTANEYTITYMNGVEQFTTQIYHYNDPVTAPQDNPSMIGYTFVAWNPALPDNMPAENLTVNAQWQINSYEVTATANPTTGGSVIGANTYNHFQTAELKAIPAENYLFSHWTENDVVVEGAGSTYSFTVEGPRSLVAHFYAMDIVKNPTFNPVAGTYNVAQQVTISCVTEGATIYYTTDGSEPNVQSYTYTDPITTTDNGTTIIKAVAMKDNMVNSAIATAEYVIVPLYSITVADVTGGTLSTNPESSATMGTVVTLTATETTGYSFNNDWSIINTTNDQPVELVNGNKFTMPAGNVSVSASFTINSHLLTIHYVYSDQTSAADDYTATLDYGSEYNVTSPAITGYTPNVATVAGTMSTADVTETVTYTINNYEVSATANPTAGGNVTGAGNYDHFATATLTATANTGYHFVNWTEGSEVVSTEATLEITVTGERNLVANFTLNSYDITVSANPTEGGTVSGAGTYNHGDNVTLTATANEGYTFVNWTKGGESVSTNPTCTLAVTGAAAYVAHFSLNSYAVSTSANPAAGGTVEGAGNYDHFATATLTATANTGYTFTNWTEGQTVVSTDATYSFEVTGARTLVANFSLNNYSITATANPTAGGSVEGAGNYNHFANATLTAIANTGYTFANWTENGVVVNATNPYTFEVTGARDLMANFTLNSYDITVSANPTEGGSVTGADTYSHDATVTLTATANEGYTFTNWTKSGVEVSTQSTYSFAAAAAGDYVANFTLNSYNITVSADPTEGGTVSGAGTYNHGDNVTLTATANEGYTFVNWTKGGESVSTNPTCTLAVTGAAAYVAHFSLNSYAVSATANPTAAGEISGAGTYSHGAEVTVSTTVNTGFSFVNWTENGNEVSTSTSYTFTFTGARTLVANFDTLSYNIAASANPNAGGTVEGAGTYKHFKTATLTATAATGYTFVNWIENGQEVSTAATYSFPVEGARNLVANFELNSYEITATSNPTTGGTVTGAGTYNHFASATLTATPANGYHFVNWTESGIEVSNSASYVFEVDGARDLVANFAITPAELAWSADNFTGYTMIDFNNWKPTVNNPNNVTLRYGCVEGNIPAQGGIMVDAATGMLGIETDFYGHIHTTSGTFHIYAVHETDETYYYDSVVYTLNVLPSAMVSLIKNIDNGGSVSMPDATDVPTLTHFYTTLAGTPVAHVAQGQNVNILAETETGYHFISWTLDDEILATTEAYTHYVPDVINTNVLVQGITAVFDTNSYTLTVLSDNETMGSANGSTTAKHFLNYEISATPNTGYHFTQWSDGNTQNPRTVTLIENTTYTAEFAINSYNLTINYKYADGTQAAATHTESVNYNATYSVTSPVLTGYTADQLVVAGTMSTDNVTVDVTYGINSYSLTINYIYTDGTTAAATHTESVNYNATYSVTSPEITGYTASQTNVSGTMPAEDVNVTVTYATDVYTLTIHYVYADNTQAANDESRNLPYGTEYSVNSPNIEGYTADQPVVSGTMGEGNVEVTVRYTINSHSLTINYLYEDGTTQAADPYTATLNYHDTYSVTTPRVAGYAAGKSVVSGTMEDGDVSINVIYYLVNTQIVNATNCSGTGTGSLSVTAPVGNFEYSIDGETFQSGTTFANLNAGDYTLYIRPVEEEYNYAGTWTVATDIAMPVANVSSNDSVFCLNASIDLDGTGSSTGSEYSYAWVGPNYSSTDVNPAPFTASNGNMSGTYILTVTSSITNCSTSDSLSVYINHPSNNDYAFTISAFDAVGNIEIDGLNVIPNFLTPNVNHFMDNIVTDYSNMVSFSNDAPDGYSSTGVYTVMWTAEDACSNTATTSITVRITQSECPFIQDIDGNIYLTVKIGTGEGANCWMAENLRTTRFADGRSLTNIYQYNCPEYPNVESNVATFGLLYDWYDAMDSNIVRNRSGVMQGICPSGWHIPSNDEFDALNTHEIQHLRSTDYWLYNAGDNATGFNMRPSGMYKYTNHRYENLLGNAYFWTADDTNTSEARCRMADCNCYMVMELVDMKTNAYSIRCVRNR